MLVVAASIVAGEIMTDKYAYEFSLYDSARMYMPNYMYVLATDINEASDYIKQSFPSFMIATMRKVSDNPINSVDELNAFLRNSIKLI